MIDNYSNYKKMKQILSMLVNAKKVQEKLCDEILLEYQELFKTAVERGFSVNRHREVEHLKEESYLAKRLIIEEVRICGGIKNVSLSKELRQTADELAEQQKKTENINLIVQSNSFRKTTKEKLVELQKLENTIQEISEKMKKY
ncbi:hypothetical protein PR048_018189 [Dryococelus australis]|uniref:Uncharacterized protein n=1 Tax=Dryococelus australis TaxID=614101 RepID=A0ABQ9HBP0_9NEOP|nr:hypothetical protein PR048_018189 [Dryococelus australis]